MTVKAKKRDKTPREAKPSEIRFLKRDNISSDDAWMILDGDEITICNLTQFSDRVTVAVPIHWLEKR